MANLKMVGPEQFAELRAHFLASGYTLDGARQRLGLKPGKQLELVALASHPPLTGRALIASCKLVKSPFERSGLTTKVDSYLSIGFRLVRSVARIAIVWRLDVRS